VNCSYQPFLLIQKTYLDILRELNRHAHQTNFLQILFVANIRNPKDKCMITVRIDINVSTGERVQ